MIKGRSFLNNYKCGEKIRRADKCLIAFYNEIITVWSLDMNEVF